MANLTIGDNTVNGHFLLETDEHCLAAGFFYRSKTKVRAVAACFGKKGGKWNWSRFKTESEKGWTGLFSPISMGRDRFTYCLITNKDIGSSYMLTTKEDCVSDFRNVLMNNFKMPFLDWWVPAILQELQDKRHLQTVYLRKYTEKNSPVVLSLNGKEVLLQDIICYDLTALSEQCVEECISELLREKKIWITKKHMKPLQFESFDDYITNYGHTLVENLNEQINPLAPLKANVDTLAIKEKSLFPQQAACINGVLALYNAGEKYAVLNEGMGVGKTIQAASSIEAAAVGKWLQKHPGKTLKDAYEKPGLVTYRAIVMAPSHLIGKWKEEIEAEIPFATATLITDFSQLTRLREEGRKPLGKEFYILSKDFCKLDTQISPIPVQIKRKYLAVPICTECREESQRIVFAKGIGSNACCPECQGTVFEPYPIQWLGKKQGLVCPCCGELLMRYRSYDMDSEDIEETLSNSVLQPADFDSHRNSNSVCLHCGASLWGSNAKPLVLPETKVKQPKWYKISHFKNHAHKGRTTAFVLKGWEDEYIGRQIATERTEDGKLTLSGMQVSPCSYGPRKVAPAKYIKKYLKGFFDFCVLDEAHKYLGESAQAVAAHALIKSSRFTIALTGTIANGTASSFYNLFYMLEPQKMLKEGFAYGSGGKMKFCMEYGCVETVYESSKTSDLAKNSMSRGRQLTQPTVKPGISPLLLGKFMMDHCIFLDLSDLSKYLPPLHEYVELVEAPSDVLFAYNSVLDTLKEASQDSVGMAALSEMLQFGLSYLDKPYGRNDIMDPYTKGAILARVSNYDTYADIDNLLPKEERLIEIVNKEISEGRNCFVYATFTGKAEANVAYRLKDILETHCNLAGRVEILQSNTPKASEREEWFHKRASEGIKVFITNPQCVETGLDFCFKYDGVAYNYPTLIFDQMSYVLSVIWQASRRGYRLNQKEECRNYYLAYENTLQATAIQIMAKKQIATAAIQGHFSAEGLSSMARGVDARAELAAALSRKDVSSRESLENMFDALASYNESTDDSYSDFVPSLTYYELVGTSKEEERRKAQEDPYSVFDFGFGQTNGFSFEQTFESISHKDIPVSESSDNVVVPVPNRKETSYKTDEEVSDAFLSFFEHLDFGSVTVKPIEPASKETKRKNVTRKMEGQISLLDVI